MGRARPTRGAAVLCGGRSSRMGRSKALLPWRGATMIEHIVGVLSAIVDDVVVVGSADEPLPDLDARLVVDREPGLGPLGGIREALAATSADLVFVTTTDAPFLDPALVLHLFDQGEACAVVRDGFVQTLAAVYPRTRLDEAERLIAADRMRPLFLLEAGGYRRLDAADVPRATSLDGCNTPHAYLEAARRDGQTAPATIELLGIARARAGVGQVETPFGTAREVFSEVEQRYPKLRLMDDDRLLDSFLLSLDGRQFVRDLDIPVGPGDRLLVLDAAAGG